MRSTHAGGKPEGGLHWSVTVPQTVAPAAGVSQMGARAAGQAGRVVVVVVVVTVPVAETSKLRHCSCPAWPSVTHVRAVKFPAP